MKWKIKILNYLIALELGADDIKSFCLTNSKISENICRNPDFWLSKIEKERPYLLSALNDMSLNLDFKDPDKLKELYLSLQEDKYYYLYNDKFDIIMRGNMLKYFYLFKNAKVLSIKQDVSKYKNKDIHLILANFLGPVDVRFISNRKKSIERKLHKLLKKPELHLSDVDIQNILKILFEKGGIKIGINKGYLKDIQFNYVKVPSVNIFV